MVRYIHPLAGNEQAVGHDLLTGNTREIAAAIIDTGRGEWDGPRTLRQGRAGVIFRLPVFRTGTDGARQEFAGFTTGLFNLSTRMAALAQSQPSHELRVSIILNGGMAVEVMAVPRSQAGQQAQAQSWVALALLAVMAGGLNHLLMVRRQQRRDAQYRELWVAEGEASEAALADLNAAHASALVSIGLLLAAHDQHSRTQALKNS